MDDRINMLTITQWQKESETKPKPGDTINFQFHEIIGTCFDHDKNGYAIIHTDTPMRGPLMVSQCQIQRIEDLDRGTITNGYRVVTMNTVVLNTRKA
jgi:hypothetical protein